MGIVGIVVVGQMVFPVDCAVVFAHNAGKAACGAEFLAFHMGDDGVAPVLVVEQDTAIRRAG